MSDSSSISRDRKIIKIFHKKYCEAEEYHCAHTFCFCLPSRKNERKKKLAQDSNLFQNPTQLRVCLKICSIHW